MANRSSDALWRLRSVGAALLLVVGSACSPEGKDWEAARKTDTPIAYEQYLDKHAGSPAAVEKAVGRLEELAPANPTVVATIYERILKKHPGLPQAERLRAWIVSADYEVARKAGTIPALAAFAARHPSAPQAKDALAAAEEISRRDRHPELVGVRTLRLEISQAIDPAPSRPLPFDALATKLIESYTGVQVAADAATDVVLVTRATGKAVGVGYAAVGASVEHAVRYARATLAGSVSLQKAGRAIAEERFAVTTAPPDRIGNAEFIRAADAPFKMAFDQSYSRALTRVLARAFGASFVATALSEKEPGVREGAAAATGVIEPARGLELAASVLAGREPAGKLEAAQVLAARRDGAAVGPLIAALKDGNPAVVEEAARGLGELKDARAIDPLIAVLGSRSRHVAAQALQKITGRSYGVDAEAWKRWREG